MNKFFLSSALPENWQKKLRIDPATCPKPPDTNRRWQDHSHPGLKLTAEARRDARPGGLFSTSQQEKKPLDSKLRLA
jgi:hypothetical protein